MQRIFWIDSLKGYLMLLVLLGHAIYWVLGHEGADNNHVYNIIYSFHMPAFFLISGWLAYRNGKTVSIGDVLKRRTYQLLLPYLLWSLIWFVYKCFETISNCTFISFAEIIIKPDSNLWFLWTLYFVCIIFLSTIWLAHRWKKNEDIFLMLMCLFLVFTMVIIDVRLFAFQFISYYFLFYTLGYLYNKYTHFCSYLGSKTMISVLFCIWLFFGWNWKMHDLPEWFPDIYIPAQLLQFVYRGVTAALGAILSLQIFSTFFSKENWVTLFLSKVGYVSLGIYCIHFFIMPHIKSGFNLLMPNMNYLVSSVVITIITLFTSLVLIECIKRSQLTNKYLLGKL